MSKKQLEAKQKKRIQRLVISWSLTFIVVIIAFGALLPQLGSYSVVLEKIGAITLNEAFWLLLLTIGNIVMHVWLVASATPGLRFSGAYIAHTASTAVSNTVPGGGAVSIGVSYAMYKSWQIPNVVIAQSVIVSGLFNNFIKLGTPIVALIAISSSGESNPQLFGSAVIGFLVLMAVVILFYGLLNSVVLTKNLGKSLEALYEKIPLKKKYHAGVIPRKLQTFRVSAKSMIASRGPVLFIATLATHATLFLLLLTALRVVGIEEETLSWQRILAAFAFGRLVTAAPVTPGGLGVAEVSYVGALGYNLDPTLQPLILSGVLLFRALTFLLPIPLGFLSYIGWKSRQ